MPTGSYSGRSFAGASVPNWAITDDYSSFANNHCGAVAVTNLALYFASRGYTALRVNYSIDDTFNAVYGYVGDGPKVTIADEAVDYFSIVVAETAVFVDQ